MYKEFEIGYNNLSHYIFNTDFVCHVNIPSMQKEKKIKIDDLLAFCLNDQGELGYGIYLAVYYHELMKVQNGFLTKIESYLDNNEINYFKQTISNEIYIQKATPNEIINLDINSNLFNNINELIFSYTYKDCFNLENKEIEYLKYREIKYDLDKIEIELGKILLPGKKKFKNEQLYITYGFEGYNGTNSTLILDFSNKFEQTSIDLNEQNSLLESLKKKDYKNILFSIQMLFYYLVNGGNADEESSIKDFIKNLPKFIVLKEDMKTLFDEEPQFKIKHLLFIYEYIEKVNCENIFDTIEILYKNEIIDLEIIKNIITYDDENKLITKIILADVIRKFISRFLTGNRTERQINDETYIIDWIQPKEELWPKNVLKEQYIFDREIDKLSKIFLVKINQSIDFYHILLGKIPERYKNNQFN
jgi:hypothetical protein